MIGWILGIVFLIVLIVGGYFLFKWGSSLLNQANDIIPDDPTDIIPLPFSQKDVNLNEINEEKRIMNLEDEDNLKEFY